ncbi:MAG: hypothetical protein QG597_2879 [Actinomycetota bacterium]|nr:hypothetical protein [Actinomycetota bacterium]
MTFALHVDAELWRGSIKAARDEVDAGATDDGQSGALVPLVESHAWGLTPAQLAQEANNQGIATLAVGTAYDAAAVAPYFDGDLLVTQPWDPRDTLAAGVWQTLDDGLISRVIRTIASTEALHRLAADAVSPVPVVLQGLTSRHCIGLQEPDLDALLADDTIRIALRERRLDIRGALLNLPAKQPGSPQVTTIGDARGDGLSAKASNRVRESWGWTVLWIRALAAVEQAGIDLHTNATTIWATHLDDSEVTDLRAALEVVPIRVVRGGDFWLSEAAALQAYGTVLAVHRVERGRDVGDRQRHTAKDGYVIAISGGISHGVGVVATTSTTSRRERAFAAAGSALDALGRVRSPFVWAGKRRMFAEPPAAGTSLLWLSADDVSEALAAGHRTPAVGDQWLCQVNLDLAQFDRVLGLD